MKGRIVHIGRGAVIVSNGVEERWRTTVMQRTSQLQRNMAEIKAAQEERFAEIQAAQKESERKMAVRFEEIHAAQEESKGFVASVSSDPGPGRRNIF